MLELENASAKLAFDFAPSVERHDVPDPTSDPARHRRARDLELRKPVRIPGRDDLLLDAVVLDPARRARHVGGSTLGSVSVDARADGEK
ncbi:MAG: hypothetical protein U0263_26020 [Polyangiaceae bacterium]